jgi:hypothetical protein
MLQCVSILSHVLHATVCTVPFGATRSAVQQSGDNRLSFLQLARLRFCLVPSMMFSCTRRALALPQRHGFVCVRAQRAFSSKAAPTLAANGLDIKKLRGLLLFPVLGATIGVLECVGEHVKMSESAAGGSPAGVVNKAAEELTAEQAATDVSSIPLLCLLLFMRFDCEPKVPAKTRRCSLNNCVARSGNRAHESNYGVNMH